MATLNELLSKRSPASRKRIAVRADQICQERTLARLREELSLSQQ